MLKVEMTGRLFRVAEALTSAGIPFNIKNVEKADIWVLEITPPVGETWTIGEFDNYVAVRDSKFEHCVTDIGDADNPIERLADAAAYFITKNHDSWGDINQQWSKDPIWLKAFLRYGIVKAKVVTSYNYVNELARTPIPTNGDKVLIIEKVVGSSRTTSPAVIHSIDSVQNMAMIYGDDGSVLPKSLDNLKWNKEARHWEVSLF